MPPFELFIHGDASTFVTVSKPFINTANSPSVSAPRRVIGGLRRSTFKVRAVSKKREPAKVVPQADRVYSFVLSSALRWIWAQILSTVSAKLVIC
ncbi:10 kDa chaperonin 1, chloroplastic, partial [Cucurbita argyrosperma subsp. sororia]